MGGQRRSTADRGSMSGEPRLVSWCGTRRRPDAIQAQGPPTSALTATLETDPPASTNMTCQRLVKTKPRLPESHDSTSTGAWGTAAPLSGSVTLNGVSLF